MLSTSISIGPLDVEKSVSTTRVSKEKDCQTKMINYALHISTKIGMQIYTRLCQMFNKSFLPIKTKYDENFDSI